jgi:hypothetical protein
MKKGNHLLFFMCLTMWTTPAWADSTVDMFVKFGGFQGKGAYEGPTMSMIKTDKKIEKYEHKFTGSIMSWAAGTMKGCTITRVDKELVWQLDPKKKTYTEMGILKFKPETVQPEDEKTNGENQVKEQKPRTRTVKTEFKVNKTGAKETINSFPCEQYVITCLNVEEDLETKVKTTSTLTTDIWNTPETQGIKKLQSDELAFTKAYLKKMGWGIPPESYMRIGKDMFFSSFSKEDMKHMDKDFKKFLKDLESIKGYSIRTTFSTKSTEEKPAGMASVQPAQEEDQSSVTSWGGFLGGIQGKVVGAASQAAKDKAKEKMSGDSNAPDFSITTEIKSIKNDPIPDGEFELPSGYVLEKGLNMGLPK